MKIYGGQDFYDCVLGYGTDPSVVLIRKNEKIPWREVPIPGIHALSLREEGRYYGFIHPKHLIVVFCSKVYYGVKFGDQYFWSADKLRSWVAEHKGCTVTIDGPWQWRRIKEFQLEDYFAVQNAPQNLIDYMIEHGYAILLKEDFGYANSEPEVTMNPYGLKHLGFAKALDPYTAYQELSMWVGGVLAGESPKIVKITSDRVLLEGHGFDNVFSFRGPRVR